jgi:hypothetical protein
VMPTIVLLMMENVIDDHDDMTVVTTLWWCCCIYFYSFWSCSGSTCLSLHCSVYLLLWLYIHWSDVCHCLPSSVFWCLYINLFWCILPVFLLFSVDTVTDAVIPMQISTDTVFDLLINSIPLYSTLQYILSIDKWYLKYDSIFRIYDIDDTNCYCLCVLNDVLMICVCVMWLCWYSIYYYCSMRWYLIHWPVLICHSLCVQVPTFCSESTFWYFDAGITVWYIAWLPAFVPVWYLPVACDPFISLWPFHDTSATSVLWNAISDILYLFSIDGQYFSIFDTFCSVYFLLFILIHSIFWYDDTFLVLMFKWLWSNAYSIL